MCSYLPHTHAKTRSLKFKFNQASYILICYLAVEKEEGEDEKGRKTEGHKNWKEWGELLRVNQLSLLGVSQVHPV